MRRVGYGPESDGRGTADSRTSADNVEFFAFHYKALLSDIWIGSVYEIARLQIERGFVPNNGPLASIAHTLHLLRIPIEKHEIALDRKLKKPLLMQRMPENGDAGDLYIYDKTDPKRGHIMPMGMSERGSIMWHALDGATIQGNWVERRTISDPLLDAWAGPAVDNAPCYALRRDVPVIFCSTWGRAF
ncbi:hypothetical protein [Bosea sp. (in: a-proteobacteria)]|uniref:hypothetical protein n=1 Tax=Bosea sp. (in: a-proteobacteria) TaxID=1871050 RepID=UPI0025B95DA3|nr:hypothetical protein [Bosea sp. (in: a-proteobacteria)]